MSKHTISPDNDNGPSLSHEQLGKAIYVLRELVWPANWETTTRIIDGKETEVTLDNWTASTRNNSTPFFGLAAEQAFDPRYKTQPLVELRYMIDRLEDLYNEKRPFYGAETFAPYAKTLAGMSLFLDGEKVGNFKLNGIYRGERSLSLMAITMRSAHSSINRHSEVISFDRLVAVASSQIGRADPAAGSAFAQYAEVDCPSSSFFAKYYDAATAKGHGLTA